MQAMKCSMATEATKLDALSVALQHPAIATDQQTLCSMLRVCTSWRQMLQQCGASLIDVSFTMRTETVNHGLCLARVHRFCQWLHNYAGTIRSITIQGSADLVPKVEQKAIQMFVAKYIQAATQLMPITSVVPASNAAMLATASNQAAPRRLLLQSFSTDQFVAQPVIISALPAATLTHLELTSPKNISESTSSALTGALKQLTNLQSMAVMAHPRKGHVTSMLLTSLEPLSTLTSLQIGPLRHRSHYLKVLPQGLRRLQLSFRREVVMEDVLLDLEHLTNLQHLKVDEPSCYTLAEGSNLPQQLEDLDLCIRKFSLSSINYAALTQLRRLKIHTDVSAEDLMCLVKLPKLQHVGLAYHQGDFTTIMKAAAVWSKLQIRDFELGHCWEGCVGERVSVDQATALLKSIAPLTQLTRLAINLDICTEEEDEIAEGGEVSMMMDEASLAACYDRDGNHIVRLFEQLKHLTSLKHLWCTTMFVNVHGDVADEDEYLGVIVAEGDMLHLSDLTGLTHMFLDCSWYVPKDTSITMLSQLKELQELTLLYEGCQEISANMPIIQSLSKLTNFVIS